VLHQVGVSFVLYYDVRKHKIKKITAGLWVPFQKNWCVHMCVRARGEYRVQQLLIVLLQEYSDSLRDGGSGVRNPVGARASLSVQTGLGAQPISYNMSTGANAAGEWR